MKPFLPLVLFGLFSASETAVAAEQSFGVAARLAVGGEGGWDYPSIDAATHRLFLSRGDHVDVVDSESGKVVGQVLDTPGVHGIALAPELNRAYISVGKSDLIKVIDLRTLLVLASVPSGGEPDSIVYDQVTGRVMSLNGRGQNATIIDALTYSVVATLPLKGKPEFARSDGRGAVFVNIEDTAELAEVDLRSGLVKSRWALKGCEDPSGLALDVVHRRSFSTCGNRTLVISNMDSGKVVAHVPIGSGVDGAEFDASFAIIFAANGEGTVTAIREINPDRFRVVQTLKTQRSARTITLDAARHRLYLPAAEIEPAPAEASQTPHPRPRAIPGSFVVLVIARKTD